MPHLPDAAATLAWGRALADELRAGDVIALCGPLGAGKTHVTQGILQGLGSADEVTSPTFTLVHEYRAGRLPVFHFDFYRLERAADLLSIGWDEYLEETGVVIAEWADLFPEVLPEGTRWFRLQISADGAREITAL